MLVNEGLVFEPGNSGVFYTNLDYTQSHYFHSSTNLISISDVMFSRDFYD
jgi:hypothetical protein